MKKITRWSLDTCGCVVEYSWDSETKEELRGHTIVSHNPCGKCEHPSLVVGEVLEDSMFHAHYKGMKAAMANKEANEKQFGDFRITR